jgi:hypothetical protein
MTESFAWTSPQAERSRAASGMTDQSANEDGSGRKAGYVEQQG